MKKSSEIGKQHLLNVYVALQQQLNNKDISQYSEPIQQTIQFIMSEIPNIKEVLMKYDFPRPDREPDLKVTTVDGKQLKVNLFSLKRGGKIQPKNLGAKSFIKKYFNAEIIQNRFNLHLVEEYKTFLQSVIETKEDIKFYETIIQLKKKVNELYPSFSEEINPIRTSFLFNLRENLFELLEKNKDPFIEGLTNGFKELMLLDSINIITYYRNENKSSCVEEWKQTIQCNEEIQFYKKGNDTIGIRIGQVALTLRLKFESTPTSSIKLATSYDTFPVEEIRSRINEQSLMKFNQLMMDYQPLVEVNDKNAIGKCNEALIYAAFIKEHTNIYQVDAQEYCKMFETYAPKVLQETIDYLYDASKTAMIKIEHYLANKYNVFTIESIHLVPRNYLKNRLDTADIQLGILSNGKKYNEDFSLKATAKRGSWITMKNPGAGTILGPSYFDIGTLEFDIISVKAMFDEGTLTHQESISEISKALGEQLQKTPMPNLKKGLEALLGKAVTVVTFYKEANSVYFEHNKISSEIEVFPQSPTPLNTFLKWNNGEEHLKLRVKFSGGQHKGWTSVKLACEYRVG